MEGGVVVQPGGRQLEQRRQVGRAMAHSAPLRLPQTHIWSPHLPDPGVPGAQVPREGALSLLQALLLAPALALWPQTPLITDEDCQQLAGVLECVFSRCCVLP